MNTLRRAPADCVPSLKHCGRCSRPGERWDRIAGNWKWMVGALALFHFFLPFFLLLFRTVKQHPISLTILAGLLFAFHVVDAYWLVMPSLHPDGLHLHWLDFTAPVGMGAIWLSFFFARLKTAPLLPQQDPGMQFAFAYAH